MALDRSQPDPQLVKQWFLDNPAVPDGTFELGLVLGGTVSAGAYTAGALDFLIEALRRDFADLRAGLQGFAGVRLSDNRGNRQHGDEREALLHGLSP